MNKKVIYTCITGDYDELKNPLVMTKGWDYICFTDQDFKSDVWQIIKIGKSENQVKHQRKKKIYNEYILDNYHSSVWVDGSIVINCDLDEFILNNCESEFSLMKHPSRDCIYQEAHACSILGKDNAAVMNQQLLDYKEIGLPNNIGMIATGVMYRKHTTQVKEFSSSWWEQVRKYSKRDQLSFNFIDWIAPIGYTTFSFNVLRTDFLLTSHKK